MNAAGEIHIPGRSIGPAHPPFLIAEMSGNHNHSLERALLHVEAAVKAGIDALKLQTYTADTLTLDIHEREFFISDPKSPWKGESLYRLYEKAHTPWEWHGPIFKRCKELGIMAFSTPFDATAVDFLEQFDMPLYKIASFENIDIPLIQKAASTGKPLIVSTGMASAEEIEDCVRAAREAGCRDLVLLKCTCTYPADPADMNLLTIPEMRRRFGVQVGLSDHTLGIGVALASIGLGATVIEKHFILNRGDGGVDSAFSMEPDEMKRLAAESRNAWKALGEARYGPTEAEKKPYVYRRSLYIAKNVKKGEAFTPENLRSIRPGYGLPPKHLSSLLGKHASRDLEKGTPVDWGCVSDKSE